MNASIDHGIFQKILGNDFAFAFFNLCIVANIVMIYSPTLTCATVTCHLGIAMPTIQFCCKQIFTFTVSMPRGSLVLF